MVNIDLPSRPRLPEWARRSATHFESPTKVKSELRVLNLHTVCESARCPNIHECFHRGAAAFTILGNLCTRGCGFRSVPKGNPRIDRFERAMRLSLRYVVVTSVNRDDLADGGSIHFAETVREIKRALPAARVEVPTPDFNGNREAVARVLDAGPHVFNHNVETVPRLYRRVRPQANYRQSLAALRFARHRQPGVTTKSGFMAGLGETAGEVEQLLRDLRDQDVDVATIGQYLLRNTRKTGRGALDQGAAARFVSSFAIWPRGTAPFALSTTSCVQAPAPWGESTNTHGSASPPTHEGIGHMGRKAEPPNAAYFLRLE